MESFLNKALIPMILAGCVVYVGCLVYFYGPSDQDTSDPAIAPVSLNPAAVPYLDEADHATKRQEESRLLFGEYPCRNDCSEHRAGYLWAQGNGISEPDNCDGLSAAFIEGCRVYAEHRTVAVAMMN